MVESCEQPILVEFRLIETIRQHSGGLELTSQLVCIIYQPSDSDNSCLCRLRSACWYTDIYSHTLTFHVSTSRVEQCFPSASVRDISLKRLWTFTFSKLRRFIWIRIFLSIQPIRDYLIWKYFTVKICRHLVAFTCTFNAESRRSTKYWFLDCV